MRYFEELQIGVPVVFGPYELLKEEIISFAKKRDPQPSHIDSEAAALTPMKGLAASSAHTFSIIAIIGLLNSKKEPIAPIASLKHEIEIPEAARPGGILSLSLTFLDKRLSKTKPDRGLVTFMYVLTSQTGKVVMRLKSLVLAHCRPSPDWEPGSD